MAFFSSLASAVNSPLAQAAIIPQGQAAPTAMMPTAQTGMAPSGPTQPVSSPSGLAQIAGRMNPNPVVRSQNGPLLPQPISDHRQMILQRRDDRQDARQAALQDRVSNNPQHMGFMAGNGVLQQNGVRAYADGGLVDDGSDDGDFYTSPSAWLSDRTGDTSVMPEVVGAGANSLPPAQLQQLASRYGTAPIDRIAELQKRADADQQGYTDILNRAAAQSDKGPSQSELYFKLAQAFLDPGKTGRFTEGLGRAAGVAADYGAEQRASASANSKNQTAYALEAQKVKLQNSQKQLEYANQFAAQLYKSGQPQSQAGKIASDEGLVPGSVEFAARVRELTPLIIKSAAQQRFGGLQPAIDNATGKPVFLQSSGAGGAIPILGYTPAAYDPTAKGAVATAVATGDASGKAQGEAQAGLADATASLPQLEKTVGQLSKLGKQATYTAGGQLVDSAVRQLGMGATPGAIAREEYTNTVRDVLYPQLRQTFGAQFTAREGDALVATLGDPNKSPEEKDAALRSFIDQKKQHLATLKRRAGASPDGGGTIQARDPSGRLHSAPAGTPLPAGWVLQ